MSDHIYLEPAKAGETLMQMQNHLKSFNGAIHDLGTELRSTASITYSAPLSKALHTTSNEVNNLGQAVNAAVYAFSHGFLNVVEEWKKTDAQSAAHISFKKPHFETIHLPHHQATRLHVSIADMIGFINKLESTTGTLSTEFDAMDSTMQDSVHYWVGESASQTRSTWRRRIDPVKETTVKSLVNLEEMLRTELYEFQKRDANNFPGRW